MSRYDTGRFGPENTSPDATASVVRGSSDVCGAAAGGDVGRLLRRRSRYIARFVFWTLWHRSVSRARWVLAYEGTSWN